MATFFISYSHNDTTFAKIVEMILYDAGFQREDVTIDYKDNNFGDNLLERMSLIREHPYVIIILSGSFFTSERCMYELKELALDKDYSKKLLPILFQDENTKIVEKNFFLMTQKKSIKNTGRENLKIAYHQKGKQIIRYFMNRFRRI